MTVSLKEHELVLVTADDGDVPAAVPGSLGLYYRDTQFLSGFTLKVNGDAPVLLSANTDNAYVATFQLVNAAGALPDGAQLPAQSLSIRRTRFLADGWRERIGILNCNPHPVTLRIELQFAASFRDMFAVRGYQGISHTPDRIELRGASTIIFEHLGRDGVRRSTDVTMRPPPDEIDGQKLSITREVPPQGIVTVEVAVVPREDGVSASTVDAEFDGALSALQERYRRFFTDCTRYRTSSQSLDTLVERSGLDVRALIDFEPTGPFPTAGIPWYANPFGRDALITSYQTLGWNPDIARGTLRFLAAHQGKRVDDFTEEQPGKIFHELRRGELARLGEVPHRPYYGTVDATPLFALVFAETVRWTADRDLWRELLPAAERALTWCETFGDADRDGYVEYGARPGQLRNQGWKDSATSLSNPDGSVAQLPAALVEVQAYVYAARLGLAELYALDGEQGRADRLRGHARELREQFERDFWLDEAQCYAQALDGAKKPVPAVTSNAGHVLWCGMASPEHATAVAKRLLEPDMFSGWGIRTLSSTYRTYNPMSYHNGSVWPHDNSLIALGLARYGFRHEADLVTSALIEAGRRFPNARLPELFCGFARDVRFASRPAEYLVSCSPQAWSAAMVFLSLRTMLGLEPDLAQGRMRIDPYLPKGVDRIDVQGLRALGTTLTFAARRSRAGVRVSGGGSRLVTVASSA